MLNLIIASTYLHKGSTKSSTPCGEHAESDSSINLSSKGMMMIMMIMDHIYIYILKVHRHGISKIRNPSAIPARSNVRVAPYLFNLPCFLLTFDSFDIK